LQAEIEVCGKIHRERYIQKGVHVGDGKVKHLCVPFGKEEAVKLRAGDYVYLSGILYTARDAAHKRMQEALQENGELPFDLENNVIYYMGPSPAREGRPIGSAGPTTASRMDKYTPALLDLGLRGMIGKGKRSAAVIEATIRNRAVYFAAVGGAGALLSRSVISSETIAYDDLGTEAIRRLEVRDFPVIVVIDSEGNNLYETAVLQYTEKIEKSD
jgi:fumarate hydratase subunit beta